MGQRLVRAKTRIVCRMSGARTASSIAGCAHANMRRNRSSGMELSASSSSEISCSTPAASSPVRLRRAASIILRRATVSSQASGARGMPLAGQPIRAAAKASDRASSAPATSPVRAARKATSLP